MAKLPTAVALNRVRRERQERLEAYSKEPSSRDVKEPEPYERPEFLDLPQFRKYPKSLGSPSLKPKRKTDIGKASELRRDARRAEGGDMDLGDRRGVGEDVDGDVEMKD